MKNIICKICNKEIKNRTGLSSHLTTHNITFEEYKQKFPEQFIIPKKQCRCCGAHENLVINKNGLIYNMCKKCKRDKARESQLNGGNVKGKETKLERYGNENYNNMTKNKQTKKSRHGNENYNNMTKTRKTKLERYGDENYNNKELWEDTMMTRYGVDHNSKIPSNKLNKRVKALQKIKDRLKRGYQIMPNYNPSACLILNEHMNLSGSVIQHAENDGEYHIEELGYWVDGYDKENNIVYEIDEPAHFINGELCGRDEKRQKEIEEYLECEFIRIRL